MKRNLILMIAFSLISLAVSAQRVTAGGGTIGNWSSPASWTGGNIPASGETVQIADGDIISFDAGATDLTIGTLSVGVGSILSIATGKTLGATVVTVSNNGQLRISTGTGVFNASGSITIGSSGQLTILGAGTITAASISGASATVSAAGAGTYSVSGAIAAGTFNTNTSSTINCGTLTVSSGTSSGTLNVNSGDLTITGSILFNSQDVTVKNGNLVVNSGGYITNSGNTVFVGTVTGGNVDVTGGIGVSSGAALNAKSISFQTGSTGSSLGGTINLNTGNWTNFGTVGVAFSGNLNNLGTLTTSSATSITFGSSGATISGASINLSAGGNLNFSSFGATITLSGNLTCKDQTSISNIGTSKFIFNGTSTIDGGSTGSGAQFYDITVNTGSSAQILNTVNLSGSLTLNGTGTFDADGAGSAIFKLLSNSGVANQGSRIASLGTPANFSGKVTIERYIPNDLYYQYLAFPVTNLTIADLQTGGFPVTGLFASGGSTRSDSGDPNASSMYFWNATSQEFANYDIGGPNSLATSAITLSNTTGYAAWAYSTTNKKIVMTGKTIATGDIAISLQNGYNLIPNPYPSAISFNSFKARTGTLAGTVYLQIDGGGAGNTYASSDGTACANCTGQGSFNNGLWTGEIALGQSFWVQSTGSATLTLQESDKTATSATFSGKTEALENYVRITLKSGDMQDQALLLFDQNGSKDFNPKKDAIKRLNGLQINGLGQSYINLSSYKGNAGSPLVFNYLPLLACANGTISAPLNVSDVSPGNHSLTFTELATFSVGYKITLKDNFLKTEAVVNDNFVYNFTTTDNALSFGAGRFELKFDSTPLPVPSIKVEGTRLISSSASGNQWYKDGVLIAGATGREFQVTQSGSYTVKTSAVSCSVESLPTVLTITGIENVGQGISVYPNPTSDAVKVSLDKDILGSLSGISLLDAKGSVLRNIPPPSDTSDIEISLNDHPLGLYILKFVSGNKVKSIKIIKK